MAERSTRANDAEAYQQNVSIFGEVVFVTALQLLGKQIFRLQVANSASRASGSSTMELIMLCLVSAVPLPPVFRGARCCAA